MALLSYWDIFGLVLITLYFISSWLYPKRTQQKHKAKAEKDEHSRTRERDDLIKTRDNDEAVIDDKSDSPEAVWSTSRSSLNGDAHEDLSLQEVNKIGSSSVKNSEKIQSPRLVSDLSLEPSFESKITSKESLESMQDDGQASRSPSDQLPSDTSTKFSELTISSEDISLSFAEIPETGIKEQVSNEDDLGSDKKDVSKPAHHEEILSNSYMECKKNVDGLPSVDVGKPASGRSDFIDNLHTRSEEEAVSREIQTSGITSCNAEKISIEIVAEAMDSIGLNASEKQGGHLEKFANDLASTTIETAVDNSITLNTFAESLSEKIFSDSADDVILEVQTSLKKQKIEAKMQKELEMEELESLGMCVASEVVNEAVGEAALKKEYMDNDDLDETSEIQPHVGFVVENVVNTAICEAASKLKRGDADEPSMLLTDAETSRLRGKVDETETNNNAEESVILPFEEISKDKANNKIAEGSQLGSEDHSDVNKPLTEELPVEENEIDAEEGRQLEAELPCEVDKPSIEDLSAETSSKDVSETAGKPVEGQSEQFIVTDDVSEQQVEHDEQQFEENVYALSAKSLKESAETENIQVNAKDNEIKANGELPVENIPASDELIDTKTKDETTISDGTKAKDEPIDGQVTAEDAITDAKAPVEDISTSHELIAAKSEDVTSISDDNEVKVKPKNEEITFEDVITTETTPVENISKSHELTATERKDSDSLETREEPPLEQNIAPTSELDNSEISKDILDKPVNEGDDTGPIIPEIKLSLDKDKSNETEGETSPASSPEIVTQHQVTLRNKDHQSGDNKDGFWRRSLILDLEENLEFEDESFEVTSPDLTKEKQGVSLYSEDSEDFTDSEEDEIIDHDAEARLGAVGGLSKQPAEDPQKEEFDWYDYEKDFDDEDDNVKDFEPVFTVDGLCLSRKHEKEKPKLRSVTSHYNRAVVLDNGSGVIKLGYAGDRVPRVIQQNVSGMPQRFSMHITGMESNLRDYKKYGSEAVAKAGVMHVAHPMKAGLIDNWTDIEEIWEYLLYEELGAGVGDNPVLVTEVSGNPRKNREKIAEILFEHLNVPAMYLADQLPLSLYASGMTTGVCLSSGFSCTQAGVVYEGHTLAYTKQQLDIGGGDLTENLRIHLRDLRARNFTTSSGWQIVNDMKETLAFVAKDYEHDMDKYQKNDSLTQYYKLPDGQMVDIGYECMACVEPLFQPDTLMSANSTIAAQQPVHKLIDTAIKRCDPELHDLCYQQIVLSGGTTLLKGFTSRLQHELHSINRRVRKIRTPEHRRYSTWIGGSILASLPIFEEQYITVDDYSEMGARIVHRKCF